MALSMYEASVPVFVRMLEALSAVLDKAEAFAAVKKIDGSVLAASRIAPDMFPMSRQVQIACDFAKGTAARLAGVDVPVYEDVERTIPELKGRIAKTISFLGTLQQAQFETSEGRDIALKAGGQDMHFKGKPYLIGFALPNFYFHLTVAYAILRHNGVDLGKRDFMGGLPTG